jgi:predicted nucleic acid-binding Zn ribbon protein
MCLATVTITLVWGQTLGWPEISTPRHFNPRRSSPEKCELQVTSVEKALTARADDLKLMEGFFSLTTSNTFLEDISVG